MCKVVHLLLTQIATQGLNIVWIVYVGFLTKQCIYLIYANGAFYRYKFVI